MVLKLCTYPGCQKLTTSGGYCKEHKDVSEMRRRSYELFTRRGASAAYNGLYRTAAWRKLRAKFLKAHPRCVVCGETATIVDHIRPHRGDMSLFLDETNLQPLCQSCHSRKTLQENGYFRRDR